jgi:hypothetical protein
MPWKIELTEDGRFSISSDAPGPQVDAAYERQKRINDHLGGRIVTAYVSPGMDAPPALISDVAQTGFEILIVGLESAEQFAALVAEVEEHGLWDQAPAPENLDNALLMATPFGFRRIASGAEFKAWLPVVDEVVIV